MKALNLVLLLDIILSVCSQIQQECLSRDYGNGGTVCVCNSDHCDTIPSPTPVEPPQYLSYTSNKAGLRFEQDVGEFEPPIETASQIRVNREEKYQKILGFGGAFTDSVGINIDSLDEDLQDKLLRSYFSEDGIEYSMCRVPIGGTDFSTHAYSYDDGDVDVELKNFALAEEDYTYKIPYMRKALELSRNNLTFFASAWIAPKWMKTNGEYAGVGFLKSDMYQVWTNYFVKFLDEYLENGIPIWGITTGNEPNMVLLPFFGLTTVGWLPWNQSAWIANYLGPTIKSSSHSDTKIIIHDDSRVLLPCYVDIALKNTTSRKYIDGIGVHWYFDNASPPSTLTETHRHFPEKFILGTEASYMPQDGESPVILGSWARGEGYSTDIIQDLQNWSSGWVDWNIVLNVTGGPTYTNNFLDATTIVNATAGEFYKQPMFYHMGHFSKFLPKESVRLGTTLRLPSNVTAVAFEKPDSGTVVIILNKRDSAVPVVLTDESRGSINLDLSERSITTIVYW